MVTRDPVRQFQLYASNLLRRKSFETTRLDKLDAEGRERAFEKGRKQIATLAERIEAQTGFALQNSRVLDFGCGVGRNALPLAERCEYVYGLDISPAVLREADSAAKRLNIDNVEWLDARRLPELSGRYDLVISSSSSSTFPRARVKYCWPSSCAACARAAPERFT